MPTIYSVTENYEKNVNVGGNIVQRFTVDVGTAKANRAIIVLNTHSSYEDTFGYMTLDPAGANVSLVQRAYGGPATGTFTDSEWVSAIFSGAVPAGMSGSVDLEIWDHGGEYNVRGSRVYVVEDCSAVPSYTGSSPWPDNNSLNLGAAIPASGMLFIQRARFGVFPAGCYWDGLPDTPAFTQATHPFESAWGQAYVADTNAAGGDYSDVRLRDGDGNDAGGASSFTGAIFPSAAPVGFTLVADPGAASVIGTDAGLRYRRGIQAATRSFPIAGTAATLRIGRRLAAASAAVAIAGTAANLVATTSAPRTLVADPGAVTVTGIAATLRSARRLTAAAAAMVIALTAATPRVARRVTAASADVVIVGASAGLDRTYRLAAAEAQVSIEPMDAALVAARQMVADGEFIGAFGDPAALRVARRVAAAPATVAIIGFSATMAQAVVSVSVTLTLDSLALISMLSDLKTWGWVVDQTENGTWVTTGEGGSGGWTVVAEGTNGGWI